MLEVRRRAPYQNRGKAANQSQVRKSSYTGRRSRSGGSEVESSLDPRELALPLRPVVLLVAILANAVNLESVAGCEVVVLPSDFLFQLTHLLGKKLD